MHQINTVLLLLSFTASGSCHSNNCIELFLDPSLSHICSVRFHLHVHISLLTFTNINRRRRETFFFFFNRNGSERMSATWMLWPPVLPFWSLDFLTGGHCDPHLRFLLGTLDCTRGGTRLGICVCVSLKILNYSPCFVVTGIAVKEDILGGGDWILAADLLDDFGQNTFCMTLWWCW